MNDWKMRREEVEKLITSYRKLRCLWDYRSNEYKLYDLKKQAWKNLGKMFGKEANVVKRKIKCLRSAYGCEKRKVDDSLGTSQIYRPNLFYYKSLNFLDAVIVSRKGPPKVDNFDHNSDPIAEYNEQPTEITFTEKLPIIADVVSQNSSQSPPQRTAEPHLKVKKQPHRLAPYYSKLDAAVNTLAAVTKTTSEESVYSSFGKTVALQLSELPPVDAAATMSEIHQILSKNTIKCMLSKNRRSHRNHLKRETIVAHEDRKLSELSELSESGDSMPNEFEEVSISY